MVDAARVCLEANERLLLATRHRLKLSRRILYYPGLSITGGSDPDGAPPSDPAGGRPGHTVLREKVRQAIEQGRMPTREPVTLHGAVGVGRRCSVCEEPVTTEETDLRLYFARDRAAGPVVHHVHVRCYSAWVHTLRDRLPSPHWARPDSHPRSPSG